MWAVLFVLATVAAFILGRLYQALVKQDRSRLAPEELSWQRAMNDIARQRQWAEEQLRQLQQRSAATQTAAGGPTSASTEKASR